LSPVLRALTAPDLQLEPRRPWQPAALASLMQRDVRAAASALLLVMLWATQTL